MNNQKAIIWFDGKLVKSKDARVHVLTHALHYGGGVFEGIRAYETDRGTAVFRLKDHVDRLFASARSLGMTISYSKSEIAKAILKTVAANKLASCYIRPIVWYGEGQMALMPRGAKIHVAIAAWPWGAYLGEHAVLSATISPYIRFHPQSVVPGAKIGGYYATSILATLDARKRGYHESILLDHEGNVAEGPGENIFIVKRGKLITPNSPSILPGITRASVLLIARHLGIPTAIKKITQKDLTTADEAFFSGTAAEVAPIGKIDGRNIGKGGMGFVTAKIQTAYNDATHGRLARYTSWLSYVNRR
ncbi:MAG TPA: branched-chain amino acid transaminase [Candidatus Paceibacterota bacterium]|nr:branched-chain amino acid transaminase [Candidatus Paceibacterota bacterium]